MRSCRRAFSGASAEIILDPRGGAYFAVVPLCMAAGVGVSKVLLPALSRLAAQRSTNVPDGGEAGGPTHTGNESA